MRHQKTLLVFALIASSVVTGNAHASLVDRGNGMIYDDLNNVTWTVNANINGLMNWTDANAWAANLVYGGYSNWVLPTISQLVTQFRTNLGEETGSSITNSHNTNYNLFNNLQNYVFWEGSESSPGSSYAWTFDAHNGDQYNLNKDNQFYAWAVRSGDVAAIPVPGAIWLFGSGLLGLFGINRRKTV